MQGGLWPKKKIKPGTRNGVESSVASGQSDPRSLNRDADTNVRQPLPGPLPRKWPLSTSV